MLGGWTPIISVSILVWWDEAILIPTGIIEAVIPVAANLSVLLVEKSLAVGGDWYTVTLELRQRASSLGVHDLLMELLRVLIVAMHKHELEVWTWSGEGLIVRAS